MALGEDRAEEKIAAMQQLYTDLGVKQDAIKAIEAYHEKAMECLAGKGFTPAQLESLKEFSSSLVHRED